MTQIAIHRLPKAILASSMPLRAMVQIDSHDLKPHKVSINLNRVDGTSADDYSLPLNELWPRKDRWLLERTVGASLPNGSYTGEFLVDDERYDLDTHLWIMDDDAYERFRRAIVTEPFVPSRGLNAQAAKDFVDQIMHDALDEDRYDLDPAELRSASPSDQSYGCLYPAGALRWITEHVATQVRFIAVAGAKEICWQTRLASGSFGLRAEVRLAPEDTKGIADATLKAAWQDFRFLDEKTSGKRVHAWVEPIANHGVSMGVELGLDDVPVEKDDF